MGRSALCEFLSPRALSPRGGDIRRTRCIVEVDLLMCQRMLCSQYGANQLFGFVSLPPNMNLIECLQLERPMVSFWGHGSMARVCGGDLLGLQLLLCQGYTFSISPS